MKKKEKLLPKIVAFIALLAIIIGIIGTGVLIVFESFFATTPSQTLSEQDFKEYLETLSGTTLTDSGSQLETLELPEIVSGTGS